jgi:hypothetical protein
VGTGDRLYGSNPKKKKGYILSITDSLRIHRLLPRLIIQTCNKVALKKQSSELVKDQKWAKDGKRDTLQEYISREWFMFPICYSIAGHYYDRVASVRDRRTVKWGYTSGFCDHCARRIVNHFP